MHDIEFYWTCAWRVIMSVRQTRKYINCTRKYAKNKPMVKTAKLKLASRVNARRINDRTKYIRVNEVILNVWREILTRSDFATCAKTTVRCTVQRSLCSCAEKQLRNIFAERLLRNISARGSPLRVIAADFIQRYIPISSKHDRKRGLNCMKSKAEKREKKATRKRESNIFIT